MTEPIWLNRAIAEAIHAEQVMEHGGSLGLRDEGLLESALARPRNRWEYDSASDLATLAAAYGFGIARNHPFVDGNKRAALVATYTFLWLNDLELEASEPELLSIFLGLAEGTVSEDALANWIRAHLIPRVD